MATLVVDTRVVIADPPAAVESETITHDPARTGAFDAYNTTLLLAACAGTAGIATQTATNTASKNVGKEHFWRIAIFGLQQSCEDLACAQARNSCQLASVTQPILSIQCASSSPGVYRSLWYIGVFRSCGSRKQPWRILHYQGGALGQS